MALFARRRGFRNRHDDRPHRWPRLILERLEDRLAPATFTVLNTLDSGVGSLRQALLDVQANAGADNIHFNIAGGGVQTISPLSPLPDLGGGPVTLDGTTQPGFAGTPLIELNGSLAGSASGLVVSGAGDASNSVIRGLVINRWTRWGIETIHAPNNLRIVGNYIGTNVAGSAAAPNGTSGNANTGGLNLNAPGSVIGGASAADRNLISGNYGRGLLVAGTGTVVQGNYVGTNASGTSTVGNEDAGVVVGSGASGVLIGGTSPGAGNLVSGNGAGVDLLPGASGNTVQGNLLGTNVSGTAAIPNGRGMRVYGGSGNLIGGSVPGARNLISGNSIMGIDLRGDSNKIQGNYLGTDVTGLSGLSTGVGVWFQDTARFNVIGTDGDGVNDAAEGNLISGNSAGVAMNGGPNEHGNRIAGNLLGTDRTGMAALPNGFGVDISSGAHDNIVGTNGDGVSDGLERNIIAFNGQVGVNLSGTGTTGNVIRGNAIFSNDGLGINLGPGLGVTSNDSGDVDSGANNLQNYPVLSSASPGATTQVAGTLNSSPNTTFTLDFYASAAPDPSGYGEGQRYLGSATVTTDGSGNASFHVALPAATVLLEWVTATATDPNGNTSEFSFAIQIVNQHPTAEAGGPYTVAEGGSVVLDGSGSSDPNQPANTLTYEWDLDGDTGPAAGRGNETGANPTFSAAGLDGPSSVTVSLRVTDNGGLSDTDTATINITNVAPVITSLSNSSPVCGGARSGQTVSISGSYSDAGTPDSHTAQINWGDGTNSPGTVTGSNGSGTIAGSHTYTQGGVFTITVTLTDDDGGSDVRTTTAVVSGVRLSPTGQLQIIGTNERDLVHVHRFDGILRVHVRLGTPAPNEDYDDEDDDEHENPHATHVRTEYPAGSVQSILILGCGGNDHLKVGSRVTVAATIDGGLGNDHIRGGGGADTITDTDGNNRIRSGAGNDTVTTGAGNDRIWTDGGDDVIQAGNGNNTVHAGDGNDLVTTGSGCDEIHAGAGDDTVRSGAGNDRLQGNAGNDQLLGESGEDLLVGAEGRDLVIGGLGADRIVGNADDDILIAGTTSFDNDAAALGAIMAEWTSARDYATRTSNLMGTGAGPRNNGSTFLKVDGPGVTVFDDAARDVLTGGQGRDWFFAQLCTGVLDCITDLSASEFANDLDFISS